MGKYPMAPTCVRGNRDYATEWLWLNYGRKQRPHSKIKISFWCRCPNIYKSTLSRLEVCKLSYSEWLESALRALRTAARQRRIGYKEHNKSTGSVSINLALSLQKKKKNLIPSLLFPALKDCSVCFPVEWGKFYKFLSAPTLPVLLSLQVLVASLFSWFTIFKTPSTLF